MEGSVTCETSRTMYWYDHSFVVLGRSHFDLTGTEGNIRVREIQRRNLTTTYFIAGSSTILGRF